MVRQATREGRKSQAFLNKQISCELIRQDVSHDSENGIKLFRRDQSPRSKMSSTKSSLQQWGLHCNLRFGGDKYPDVSAVFPVLGLYFRVRSSSHLVVVVQGEVGSNPDTYHEVNGKDKSSIFTSRRAGTVAHAFNLSTLGS